MKADLMFPVMHYATQVHFKSLSFHCHTTWKLVELKLGKLLEEMNNA